MRKINFFVIAGLVLFFSFFLSVPVMAVDNKCGCTYSISGEAAGGASLACIQNGTVYYGKQICDCMLTNYSFILNSGDVYLFGDVWNIEKSKFTSNGAYCQAFDLLFDQYKTDVITIADGGSPDYCKYEKNVTDINGVKFNYNIKCAPSSIPPAPAPTPPEPTPPAPAPTPVVETTLCECYKNQTSIDAKKAEGSNQNNPKKEEGCAEMSAQKSGGDYSYLICHYFVNKKFQSSWSQGKKVDANKIADPTAASAAASTNPGSGASSNEATKAWIKEHYQPPAGYAERGGVIPDCAFSGTCENVNDLLQLGINIGKYVFSIIGSVAFLAFVYGGFTIVFSFGSSEKVKKGTEVIIAAVTGMAIAFGAYLLINFILDALNVTSEFRGIKG